MHSTYTTTSIQRSAQCHGVHPDYTRIEDTERSRWCSLIVAGLLLQSNPERFLTLLPTSESGLRSVGRLHLARLNQ